MNKKVYLKALPNDTVFVQNYRTKDKRFELGVVTSVNSDFNADGTYRVQYRVTLFRDNGIALTVNGNGIKHAVNGKALRH